MIDSSNSSPFQGNIIPTTYLIIWELWARKTFSCVVNFSPAQCYNNLKAGILIAKLSCKTQILPMPTWSEEFKCLSAYLVPAKNMISLECRDSSARMFLFNEIMKYEFDSLFRRKNIVLKQHFWTISVWNMNMWCEILRVMKSLV